MNYRNQKTPSSKHKEYLEADLNKLGELMRHCILIGGEMGGTLKMPEKRDSFTLGLENLKIGNLGSSR